ncbi:alpha/beta fold hydrolase [Streptomyces sp. WAC07149]|uniref:alpha/beta fold hydrolase n=1 Tax=Streptomyces sp. WAC07149 TaxID=2487425 RepID=UPI000F76E800|nr:alpha/beta fold hydrolase [Streptomyces sp. WAC07149]RST07691.1 alpha/beta fold hydrolase [Streptomyces sp. WAC07149]
MNPQFGNGAASISDDFGPRGAEAVLLVHGHPFNRSIWARQATAPAAAGYRVIAPDLRGYGDNPAVGEWTLLADFADDLAALLRRLGIERAVVGGVSMGGQIALELRLRHPGLVRALVLCDTSPVPETEDGKEFRRKLAERLLAEGMRPYTEEVIDKMLAPYNVTGQPEAAARVTAVTEGAGHLPGVEQPEAFKRTLLEFRAVLP